MGFQMVEVPSSQPDLNDPYMVIVPPWDHETTEIICECEGYKHRGYCRHQSLAMELACDWVAFNGESQTPEEEENHVCPRCGGPTKTIIEDTDV